MCVQREQLIVRWRYPCSFKYSQCEQFAVPVWTKGILVYLEKGCSEGWCTHRGCVVSVQMWRFVFYPVDWLSQELWRLYEFCCGRRCSWMLMSRQIKRGIKQNALNLTTVSWNWTQLLWLWFTLLTYVWNGCNVRKHQIKCKTVSVSCRINNMAILLHINILVIQFLFEVPVVVVWYGLWHCDYYNATDP